MCEGEEHLSLSRSVGLRCAISKRAVWHGERYEARGPGARDEVVQWQRRKRKRRNGELQGAAETVCVCSLGAAGCRRALRRWGLS